MYSHRILASSTLDAYLASVFGVRFSEHFERILLMTQIYRKRSFVKFVHSHFGSGYGKIICGKVIRAEFCG